MQGKSENNTCIKEKILYYIDTQGIKKEEFYKKVGIDGANFRGNNLKSDLSADKIVKILRQYPEISTDWLLLDIGEMLRDEVSKDGETVTVDAKSYEALHKDLEEFREQASDARQERKFFIEQINELKKTSSAVAPRECDAGCAAAV